MDSLVRPEYGTINGMEFCGDKSAVGDDVREPGVFFGFDLSIT